MTHANTCPVCGENRLRPLISENEVEIDGIQVSVPAHSHECEACGSNVALSEDLRTNARAVRHATKVQRGMLTGAQVRELRKRLGLNQEQAACLFGGGPVAFSKYEHDEIVQSESMDRLLWVVGEFPWLVDCLAHHVNITLPGGVSITIEKSAKMVSAKYFAEISEHFEFAGQALRGFQETSSAGNDEIYRPNVDAGPANRMAA